MNIRLPNATFKWLKEWYDNERRKKEQEEGPIGPCMNHIDAPSYISHLDAHRI